MNAYDVTLTGKSPLLMHWDNIDYAEQLKIWREVPENKKYQVKGDDRSPAWSWIGSLYHDGEHVAMPSDNLGRVAMEGGASVPVPRGKNGKTFKSQTQSGMMVEGEFTPLLIGGKAVPVEAIKKLHGELEFSKHQEVAAQHVFCLFVKRARIGASKHVRVRPRFDSWSLGFRLHVWDDQLTLSALQDIYRFAGENKGLGDWRPSSKTPGPFGRFEARVQKI